MGRKARVLVIDDEPMIREVLAESLAGGAFEVLFASDGGEGLEKAVADPPAAIVVDLLLPRMNGYEVIQRLKENPATRGIPIVVTSAKSYPSDVRKALDLGAVEFVPKPFDVEALAGILAGLVGIEGK